MPRVSGDAREAILDAAFRIFSERGYGATSMRDIADAVGMKAASLYNHFGSKRDIFDALVARETSYVEEALHAAGALADPADDPVAYGATDASELEGLVWESYAPFFMDERVRQLHRMLSVSRYADPLCSSLFERVFIERPLALQEKIFSHLVETGAFAPCDAGLAAMEFHGPMFMLIDSEADAKRAHAFCKAHVASFNAAHRKERRS